MSKISGKTLKEGKANKSENELTSSVKSALAYSRFLQGDMKEFYKPVCAADDTLVFESRFESGNLKRAIQTGAYEYDLMMNPDFGTGTFMQWYYFRVSNTRKGKSYRLNIINHMKPDGLYNEGMRPLLYSVKESETGRYGWSRAGEHIRYFTNQYSRPNLSRITGNGVSSTQSVYQQQGSDPPFVINEGLGNYATLSFDLHFKRKNGRLMIDDHDTVYIC